MEEESNKKRKKLCDLELSKLVDKLDNDDEEPPSLVVTNTVPCGDDVKLWTDSQLEDSIKRNTKTLENMAANLPDGGRKLKERITSLQLEKEGRERHRRMDTSRGETLIQSQSSSIKGTLIGFKQVTHQSSSPQSQFGPLFCQKFEENQANRTTDASGNLLNTLGRCDRRETRSNGLISSMEKCKSRLSSRQTAFQSPGILSGDVEKLSVSNGDIHSSPGSSDQEEAPLCFSSRKSPPMVNPSYNLRSRNREKVQTVILVDEEEHQHVNLVDVEENMDASMKEIKIYFPSRCHPESVEINYVDVQCLAPETYLSSTIMNFYIRYLEQSTITSDSDRRRYHFFTTYFYEKLKEAVQDKKNDAKDMFSKFRRWWKGVNIFQKAYIFLPIHENHHWSLVIICIPDKEDESVPILLHYDSLGLHSSRSIFENIKSFLKKEWTYLKEKETSSNCPIADSVWKNLPRRIEKQIITVPQQKDEYDCGLFVLLFMQRFIEEAPQRLKKKDLAMFGKQWFDPKEASGLRPKIRALITKLFKENPEGESRG
ncbi:ubiquitin-like-specific protease 1D [Heracleum sosnowskyi]|uniref:Ubiquitin-like-specific protease 1D n=1 Tax=Heracleum sosnowskyi TaxID=360622 RepID=A0AAD8MKW9_9APIA|nr:ubiquitin-like-specific protease 1D [Heracleum sosnowskyi]